jgi:hypothetical protein
LRSHQTATKLVTRGKAPKLLAALIPFRKGFLRKTVRRVEKQTGMTFAFKETKWHLIAKNYFQSAAKPQP